MAEFKEISQEEYDELDFNGRFAYNLEEENAREAELSEEDAATAESAGKQYVSEMEASNFADAGDFFEKADVKKAQKWYKGKGKITEEILELLRVYERDARNGKELLEQFKNLDD